MSALMRVPAAEIKAGDLIGEGQWQGARVLLDAFPRRLLPNGRVLVVLSTHKELEFQPHEPVLVERRTDEPG